MLGRLILPLIMALVPVGAQPQSPRVEWSYDTRGKIYSSPVIADVDGDGRSEVIVTASRDHRVLCFGGDGEVRWQYQICGQASDGLQATPSVVDYDGDGRREVFFADNSGVVGCLDYRGRLIWRVFTGDRINYSAPVVADIDGDGRIEVLFGTLSGTLYCLDDTGSERWHYQADGSVEGVPAVLRDPHTSQMRVYAVFTGGMAACLSSEGKVVWSHNEPSETKRRCSGPALGDLDGDGRIEMVCATADFQVIVVDALTGAERWRWKGRHQVDQTNSFALADLDGSGHLDIICGDGSGLGGPGSVYVLRNGKALWSTDVPGGVVQGPSVGDVDGDGELEILVCTRENRMTCLSRRGARKWDVACNAGALSTPALGDIDADGQTEIVFTCKDGFVRSVSVGGAYRADRMPWPCLNHDAQLTGSFTGAAFQAVRPSQPRGRQQAVQISGFDVLQTGENRIEVAIANLSYRPRHLEAILQVTAPDGRLSTQTISRRLSPYATHREAIHLDALIAGNYALSMRLSDIGTGAVLLTQQTRRPFVPLAHEQQAIAARLSTAADLVRRITDPELRTRALRAISAAQITRRQIARDASSNTSHQRTRVRRIAESARAALRECDRMVARLRAAASAPSSRQDFAVTPVTSLRKVFRDEPCPAGEPARIEIAGNEYEGIQLVVVPLWKGLRNLRASVSDAVHANGASRIHAADIDIRQVGYIQISPPEYNWHVAKLGWYPDVLLPSGSLDVPADQDAQPYFLTVHARKGLAPGDYRTTVTFRADGCSPVAMPLRVHVWNFSLTDETHLKTAFSMSEGSVQAFYRYPEGLPASVRHRYYDLHLEHRVGPVFSLGYDPGEALGNLDYAIAHGQNNFFVSVPGYLPESQREQEAQKLRALRQLVRDRGWSDHALFYSRDEVAVMARNEIPQVVEMNSWTRSVIPEWPRLETSAPEQSLFGAVDIWCPTVDNFDASVLAQRKARGDRLWFYTVWGRPGIMIEFPATDHRLMFWECWKYGAEGFLYYATTSWDLNMSTDRRWPSIPWIATNRQPGHNGCGYLIYPGANGTPLASLRLAVARDGIEDYEYLYTLRQALRTAGNRAPAQLRARALAELDISPKVLVDNMTFTEDPAAILAARSRIASLIEQFRALPRP